MGDTLDDVSEDFFRVVKVADRQYRVFNLPEATQTCQNEGNDFVTPSTDLPSFGHCTTQSVGGHAQIDNNTASQIDPDTRSIATAQKPVLPLSNIPNYFINIPMTDPALQKNVELLYSKISSLTLCPYVDPFLMDINKLHITIVMLVLDSESKVEEAKILLNTLNPEINTLLGDNELQVEFEETLLSMQSNPSACRVVYAKPTRSTEKLLRPIVELIFLSFMKRGLTQLKALSLVNLHMTILNTRKMNLKKSDKRETVIGVDVRPVLKLSHKFSIGRPSSIHLSQRHRFDESGYYYCASKIDLPRRKN